jgi:uncharacterized protein involved in exopolysaccharide biosynthesis
MTDGEDTIELGWYLRGLKRHWRLAAVGTLVGGVLGFGFASIQPLRYEGVTTLLVIPPIPPNSAQINPATFRAIVENASLAAQIISELKLAEGENALTPSTFVEDALRVEEVRGTNVVRVRVTLRDPRTAAEASRRLAAKAKALTQQVSPQDGAAIEGQLKNHLNDAQQQLASAERALLTYKQRVQVDVLKQDADAQLRERGELPRLLVEIEAEKARLASALTAIKEQQPLLIGARAPGTNTDASTVRTSDEQLNDRRPATPYMNPVYQTLEVQIATSRIRIAALETQREELVIVKKIGGRELELLRELYLRQVEQARLQANFDLATRVYNDLAMRYEQIRTQPPGATAQLTVIDEAQPADRPVSRRRRQYATYGAAAGFVLSVMLVPIWESRGRRV